MVLIVGPSVKQQLVQEMALLLQITKIHIYSIWLQAHHLLYLFLLLFFLELPLAKYFRSSFSNGVVLSKKRRAARSAGVPIEKDKQRENDEKGEGKQIYLHKEDLVSVTPL